MNVLKYPSYDYITLLGKGEIILVGYSNHINPLKTEFSLTGGKKDQKHVQLNMLLLSVNMDRTMCQGIRGSLSVAPANSQQKNGDLSPATTRNELCQQLN